MKMTASFNVSEIRYRENLLFALLSVLGYLFGARELNAVGILRCVLFAASVYALVCAVRSLGERRPQKEKGDSKGTPKDQGKTVIGFLLFSFVIVIFFFTKIFWIWLTVLVLLGCYFSGWIKLKQTPVVSTMVFFSITVLLFVSGYAVEYSIDANAFLFAIYFGVLFAAGQLVGEIIEHNFDLAKKQNSNVVVFGPERVSRFSFCLFAGAFIYLMMLTVAGLVMPVYSLPFLFAFLFQVLVFLKLSKGPLGQRALVFQFAYRALYGIAAVIFVVLRFAFSI